MALQAQAPDPAPATPAGVEFRFRHRPYSTPGSRGGGSGPPLEFSVTVTPGPPRAAQDRRGPGLRGAAAFLVDTAHGLVPSATLARMIGCFFLATDDGPGASAAVTVTLANTGGDSVAARVGPGGFEIERTAFGAAHILHEDDILGLYILEIAPHSAIPAHCHRVMRESELILDDGLLQQGWPVARGNAYAWPLGHVHAYRNPTAQPRRILCVDSPRFMPEDERPLTAAVLAPLAPLATYPG